MPDLHLRLWSSPPDGCAPSRSRSRQVSALQAGGEKKRTRVPNEVPPPAPCTVAAPFAHCPRCLQRLAPAREAAVSLYEFGGGFARARFGAGPEELYEEPESPREMLRRKQGYKVKNRKDLGELVNLRKAELAQAGGTVAPCMHTVRYSASHVGPLHHSADSATNDASALSTCFPPSSDCGGWWAGRGAAHLLSLEELFDEVDAQAEASSSDSVPCTLFPCFSTHALNPYWVVVVGGVCCVMDIVSHCRRRRETHQRMPSLAISGNSCTLLLNTPASPTTGCALAQ